MSSLKIQKKRRKTQMEIVKIGLFLLFYTASAKSSYCNFTEKPHFLGKHSVLEIANAGDDRCFHLCNARNTCKVRWYKDNRRLNLSDNHIKSQDFKHETICISSIRLSDEGVYKCVAWNNVGSINRSVNITVDDGGVRTCQNISFHQERTKPSLLRLGEPYQVTWLVEAPWRNVSCYYSTPGSLIYPCNLAEENETVCSTSCSKYSSNKNQFRTTLRFKEVRDYHLELEYSLRVHDPEFNAYCRATQNVQTFKLGEISKTHPVVKKPLVDVFPVCSILLIACFGLVTWRYFNVHLRLLFKDYLSKPEHDDGRMYDAYISYTWSDVDRLFVLHLKSHLERRGYKVYVPEIDTIPGGCTAVQLVEALRHSRRFIMVLSPDYVRASFTAFEVNVFLEAVNLYKDHIIPIVFKGWLPPDESAIYRHVMKVTQTVTWANIEWPISDQYHSTADSETEFLDNHRNTEISIEMSFRMRGYKQLLLKLPPKPKGNGNDVHLV